MNKSNHSISIEILKKIENCFNRNEDIGVNDEENKSEIIDDNKNQNLKDKNEIYDEKDKQKDKIKNNEEKEGKNNKEVREERINEEGKDKEGRKNHGEEKNKEKEKRKEKVKKEELGENGKGKEKIKSESIKNNKNNNNQTIQKEENESINNNTNNNNQTIQKDENDNINNKRNNNKDNNVNNGNKNNRINKYINNKDNKDNNDNKFNKNNKEDKFGEDNKVSNNSNNKNNIPNIKILKKLSLPILIPKLNKLNENEFLINYSDIIKSINSISHSNNNKSVKAYCQKNFEIYSLTITHQTKRKIKELILIYQIIKKIKDTTKSNSQQELFKGPYLIGSFNRNLNTNNSSIDILYTTGNLQKILKLNKVMITNYISYTMSVTLNIKDYEQTDPIQTNNNLLLYQISIKNFDVKINFYFMDLLLEDSVNILNKILLTELIIAENNEEGKDIITLGKLFRLMRRNFDLLFIIPEIFDVLIQKFYNGSISGTFLEIIYFLYKRKFPIDDKGGKNDSFLLISKIIDNWYKNINYNNNIIISCENIIKSIYDEKFENIFYSR